MNAEMIWARGGAGSTRHAGDERLAEILRRERRHSAVAYLATGIAIGIGFSLTIDTVLAAVLAH